MRESSSGKASRATADSGALERKTVRSGFAYDINGGGGSTESFERARRLKEELGSAPVTGIEDRVAYRVVKRAFDIVFSAAVLVVFCWLFAIISILIKVDDPKGPVFFSQERVGKDGRTFRMLKFRSMCVDAEDKLAELRELNEKTGPVFKIAEDPRITRVGKWLRKLSLDELPQFINVLRSDMSIVGPRPALPAEVATYDDYQRQRLLVKPGMTCYWQTRRNRDSITFDEWVDLDLCYECFYPLGSYHLLRRKSDFAKLTQKKNAATSKKITTLSKSCSVLSRTFLFALFFDFGNLLCRCGYNPYACIAHTVKKRVKLPPLRVLLRRRF